MDNIKDGWVFDKYNGGVCFFEHYPLLQADEILEERKLIHVVETVNGTYGENKEVLHRNKYFAWDLPSAIVMAARMEIEFREVAEDVVAVRVATEEEALLFHKVKDFLDEPTPSAISSEQAQALLDS